MDGVVYCMPDEFHILTLYVGKKKSQDQVDMTGCHRNQLLGSCTHILGLWQEFDKFVVKLGRLWQNDLRTSSCCQ